MISFKLRLSLKDYNNSGLRTKEQIKVFKINLVQFQCIITNLIRIIIKKNLKGKFYFKKQLSKEKKVKKQQLIKEKEHLIKYLKTLDLLQKQHLTLLFHLHTKMRLKIKIQRVKVDFLVHKK